MAETFRFGDLAWRAKASYLAHAFKATAKRHHREIAPLLACFVAPEATVLDIGGHAGQFAKLLARMAKQGHVYSFEPAGYARSILRLAVRLNGLGNVTVVPMGLGDGPGTLELTTPLKSGGTFRFGLAHMGKDGRETQGFHETVAVTTIDDFAAGEGLRRLDFIKMDVEGWEMRILEGGADSLRRFLPTLMVELVDSQLARAGDSLGAVWRLLEGWGYRPFLCHDLRNLTPADAPCEGDIFWLPPGVEIP